jgi:hypothetical protein
MSVLVSDRKDKQVIEFYFANYEDPVTVTYQELAELNDSVVENILEFVRQTTGNDKTLPASCPTS